MATNPAPADWEQEQKANRRGADALCRRRCWQEWEDPFEEGRNRRSACQDCYDFARIVIRAASEADGEC